MSITDYKITDAALNTKGVIAAPDTLTGRAEENKAVFDRLSREVVAPSLNGVIDTLAGTDGAANVGAAVDGVAGDNVQAVLDGMLPAVRSAAAAAAASADEAAAYARQAAAHTDLPITRGEFGIDSLVMGNIVKNKALDHYAVAEGEDTVADGWAAHAEGYHSRAIGMYSHAENGGSSRNPTTASGRSSHAEGEGTTASEYCTHSEGAGTTASGPQSHAEGAGTTASGGTSHAEGWGTVANHKCQHVFGEYNNADPSADRSYERGQYVEIVGNGTADDARSNARTLDWDGNEVLAGGLTLGANPAGDMDAVPKRMVRNPNILDNAYFIGGGGWLVPKNTTYYSNTALTTVAGTTTEPLIATAKSFGYASINIGGTTYYVSLVMMESEFPVNQRGASSYNVNDHGIDRWSSSSANGYTITALGLSFSGHDGKLKQLFERERIVDGATYTLSVLSSAGLAVITGVLDSTIGDSWQMGGAVTGGWFAIRFTGGLWDLRLNASDGVTLHAAKLERGFVQTLARNTGTADNPVWVYDDNAPDYATELAKCQRYQQISPSNWTMLRVAKTTSDNLYFTLPLPVPLRGAPTKASFQAMYENGTIAITPVSGWSAQSGFTIDEVSLNITGLKIVAKKVSHGLSDASLQLIGSVILDANL